VNNTYVLPADVTVNELAPEWEESLAGLLVDLRRAGDESQFHPHPLTREAARELSRRLGRDFYCVLVKGRRVIGYGMLRGWDAGFRVPTLGIAIHPEARGKGYGRTLMHALHKAASERGAERILLKVYTDNHAAVSLYRSLGYEFSSARDGELQGVLALPGEAQS
jgi:ribosomal protein S18 acetylase RimI-like enzyme